MIRVQKGEKVTNIEDVVEEVTPSFSGIVTGDCKGKLWVDQMINPRLAIAESYAVGSFEFLGKPMDKTMQQELQQFLYQELFPQLRQKGYQYFEFDVKNDQLKKQILEIFSNERIEQEEEYSFRKQGRIEEEISVPTGYEIVRVTEEMLDTNIAPNYSNVDFFRTRILESWWNAQDFYRNGLAYCIIHKDKIAAVIAGTARFQNVVPIDIETLEEERCNGLGTILGKTFINQCISMGITPQWDCMETNIASNAIANKLGFQKFDESTVYWFPIS